MPVIKTPELATSVDPKNASVFDPLYKTLMRKAASFTGMDTPEGQLTQGLFPTPLVAGVAPKAIPALRQAGKDMLDRVLKSGLEVRSLGNRPLTSDGVQNMLQNGMKSITEADYKPNIPIPDNLKEALIYAQQKYPRIFGHIKDIAGVDSMTQLRNLGGVLGEQRSAGVYNSATKVMDPTKFSKLGLNVEARNQEGLPFTLGHELLHAADNIVSPTGMKEGYKLSMELPGGYGGSAYEARANVQGQRFANGLKGIPNPKPQSLNAIEDTLLKREVPTQPMDPVEWLHDKFKKLIGKVDPDGTAASLVPPPNKNHQIMTAGDKMYKKINGHWMALDDATKTTELNWRKPVDAPQAVSSVHDLSHVTPPTVAPSTSTTVGAKAAQMNGRLAGLSKSRLNQSMILEIRKRADAGAHYEDLAKEYGVSPSSMHEIVKRNSWTWVK